MAIPFGANIELLQEQPNFTRDLFPTFEAMRNFATYKLPALYLAFCSEDEGLYLYNKNNDFNPLTGRWRKLPTDGVSDYLKLSNKPSISGKEVLPDSTYQSLGLATEQALQDGLDSKVDKIEGKQLSTEDFTTAYKNKLESLEPQTQSDFSQTDETAADYIKNKPAINGNVLTKDSTAKDLDLYTAGEVDSKLYDKVDKVEGKQLSSEDFTSQLKDKLDSIETGAQVNVKPDWNQTTESAPDFILNKPELFDGNYKNLYNAPVNLSDFVNDLEFVSKTTTDLVNYYTKSQLYTAQEIDSKLGAISSLQMMIVESLPEVGSPNIIYLIAKTGTTGYLQYIYSLGEWAIIGDTDVDLSEYVKASQLSVVATSGLYSDLIGKPTVPEKVSDLENDLNFTSIDDDNQTSTTTYSSNKIVGLISQKSGTGLGEAIDTNITVGGIPEGTHLAEGTTLTQLFQSLLVKYLKPVINSFTITPATTLYEKGTSVDITAMSVNVTKKSETLASVKFYQALTLLQDITEGIATGGAISLTDTSQLTPVTDTTTFKVSVRDSVTGSIVESSKTITFALPYFYGVQDSTDITDLSVYTKNLSTKGNKTYKFTASNQHIVILYDSSYGVLKSIKDGNNFENITDFDTGIVTFDSYAYRYYITKGKKTVTGFSYTFSY